MAWRFEKIHARFKDGWTSKELIWYKTGYDEVKNTHPEVETHFAMIRETIENPQRIKQDADYDNRLCYYTLYAEKDAYKGQYMKVVIQKSIWGPRVVTAYFTINLKEGEELKWSHPQWKKR